MLIECCNHEPWAGEKSVVDRVHELKSTPVPLCFPSSPPTSLALHNSHSFSWPSTNKHTPFSHLSLVPFGRDTFNQSDTRIMRGIYVESFEFLTSLLLTIYTKCALAEGGKIFIKAIFVKSGRKTGF